MDKKNILTYEGLKKLEDELEDLKVVKRKEVSQKIKEAREQGDLSENAEYDAAKDEQRDIEARIEELEKILKNAEVFVEEADQLIEDMPKIEQLWVPDDRQREARYKEAMNTCDYRAWVSIVKTLYIRKQERTAQGKKITALDERYMRTAENELYSELSLTLGIPKDEMEQYIRERLTQ